MHCISRKSLDFVLVALLVSGASHGIAAEQARPITGGIPRLAPDSALISGELRAPKPCQDPRGQLWLSRDGMLVYQLELPSQGTFEIHVVPARYHLVVTTSNGCFAETDLTLKAGEVQKPILALSVPKAAPSPAAGGKKK